MRNHLRLLAGVVGVCYLLLPRQSVSAVTRLAYRGAPDAEPREWVYVAARLEGAALALFALRSLFRAAESADTGPVATVASLGDAAESDEE